MPKPTPAQARLIRHFNGDNTASMEGRRASEATYEVCERNDWIERTEAWPYHRTTEAGAEAIGVDLANVEDLPKTYTAASGKAVERATCQHDGRPIFRNQHVLGDWIHEDGTAGRWCEGFQSTAEPEVEFPAPICPIAEPHAKHQIPGTWREECPGVQGPEIQHNATGEYACTECGHQGNGQVPGCTCIGCDDTEIGAETACVAHGAEGCEWCFPVSTGLTGPVGPQPSTGAVLAAGALKSASRVSGLVTVFVHWDLLERMCELGLLREDQEHDVFVDSAGYEWLRNGADMAALDNLLQVP